jgi:UDP-N-acetylmuramate dehydrogenase
MTDSSPQLAPQAHVPLAPFTTFGLGGAARYFVRVSSLAELREAIAWASVRSLSIFFLGGGSNLVVSDDGFDGLVVKIELRGIELRDEGDDVLVTAAAGEEWDALVAFCVERNLAGIECLSGIPGCVGATPIQNVGAYGQDVSETVSAVEVLDRRDGTLRHLTPAECEFGYRSSFFKNVDPERYVVTAVTYRLRRGGSASLRYPELENYVREHHGESATLQQVRESVIAIRKRKGMVIDPADPDTRSAGSFFMNPLLDADAFADFERRVAAAGVLREGESIPRYPAAAGKVKTSAAWLIERAGFRKGYGEGAAGISSKHTLALVNRGGATTKELVALVEEIQRSVREKFGVELHPEPNFVGF